MAKTDFCEGCKQSLSGDEYILAQDQGYHESCFTCTFCEISLLRCGFILKEGNLHCPTCYHDRFSPRCSQCSKTITESSFVSAMGKSFHPQCLQCSGCRRPFDDGTFQPLLGELWCSDCWKERFGTKCDYCNLIIELRGFFVEEIGKHFHEECFLCAATNHLISDGEEYHLNQGKLYCKEHFSEILISKCAKCGDDIIGDHLNIHDNNYHLECFRCSLCRSPIKNGCFTANENDKIICSKCMEIDSAEDKTSSTIAIPSTLPSKDDYQSHTASKQAFNRYQRSSLSNSQQSISGVITKVISRKNTGETSACNSADELNEGEWFPVDVGTYQNFLSNRSRISSNSQPAKVTKSEESEKPQKHAPRWKNSSGSKALLDAAKRFSEAYSSSYQIAKSNTLTKETASEIGPKHERRKTVLNTKFERCSPESVEQYPLDYKGPFYPLDLLQNKLLHELPKGVDHNHKEMYLEESTFQSVSGMSKKEFYSLPDWKQRKLRHALDLF